MAYSAVPRRGVDGIRHKGATNSTDRLIAQLRALVSIPPYEGRRALIAAGSGTLPGIPCPQDLSCDLAWIRAGDRLELLQPAREAIGQVQITELIR